MPRMTSHRDLRVFNQAMNAAMEVFELTKGFPADEKYSLVDQIRRSSRSVCANLAEAWAKRRYEAAFVAKLSDAESEAYETQVWLEFASRCGYLSDAVATELKARYRGFVGQIVKMIQGKKNWMID